MCLRKKSTVDLVLWELYNKNILHQILSLKIILLELKTKITLSQQRSRLLRRQSRQGSKPLWNKPTNLEKTLGTKCMTHEKRLPEQSGYKPNFWCVNIFMILSFSINHFFIDLSCIMHISGVYMLVSTF